jgi:class 3 adenylate cyclase
VIGDTINVAWRIEGMARSYPVGILLSDATREAIAGAAILYQIATVQGKNRIEPLTLWAPEPLRHDSEERTEEDAA